MDELAFFMMSIRDNVGEGKRFLTWKRAYEHYFVVHEWTACRTYNPIFCPKIAKENVNYELEFEKALKEGIHAQLIEPRPAFRRSEFILPPAFRYERAFLLELVKYKPSIVAVADSALKADETFWREAITSNYQVIMCLEELTLQGSTNDKCVATIMHEKLNADKKFMHGILIKFEDAFEPSNAEIQQERCLIHKLELYMLENRRINESINRQQSFYYINLAGQLFFGNYETKHDKFIAATTLRDHIINQNEKITRDHLPALKNGRLGKIIFDWEKLTGRSIESEHFETANQARMRA